MNRWTLQGFVALAVLVAASQAAAGTGRLEVWGRPQTSVAVTEGQSVAAGAPIGAMGAGPDGAPMLYFEIRLDGKPVNPLSLLPAR